ncbi:MAG: SUF system Fe-S cluster assembly regulator [Candidatus Binatia bacterium]
MTTRRAHTMAAHLGGTLIALALAGAPAAAAQCGDGVATAPEECDDANLSGGDGCSATCQLEDASALCAGVATQPGTALSAVRVAAGLTQPVQVTAPALDPRSLFIVEKGGTVRILRDGALLATPFLDLTGRVSSGAEQGLLSIAFHPNFENNHRVFVAYTDARGVSVLSRFESSAGSPDVVSPATERVLLVVPHAFPTNNGGALAFGPDGRLYYGLGDGGGVSDPSDNSQSAFTLLGKILRLNVDVDVPPYYAVPPDNPNAALGMLFGLVWAKGARNPWRFAFDRLTGALFIGDIGEAQREEIDVLPPGSGGANLGWDVFEGSLCFEPAPLFPGCPAPTAGFTFPVREYDHGQGCAVTGGFAYRGCALPDLSGTCFYGDRCSAFVRSFALAGGVAVGDADHTAELAANSGLSIDHIISFGEDARGELYVVDQGGEVFQIVGGNDLPTPTPTTTALPSATATATPADTDTPVPSETATPADTQTPTPTDTVPPTATAIPPTDTPQPTATFVESTPTAVVRPTNTRRPSATRTLADAAADRHAGRDATAHQAVLPRPRRSRPRRSRRRPLGRPSRRRTALGSSGPPLRRFLRSLRSRLLVWGPRAPRGPNGGGTRPRVPGVAARLRRRRNTGDLARPPVAQPPEPGYVTNPDRSSLDSRSAMIRISRLTDYGIVLLSHMAAQPDHVHTAAELAGETHLPLPTVSKLLRLLTREGLLQSQRGVNGGYGLARAPEAITVSRAVAALEGPIALTTCTSAIPTDCSHEPICPVRGHLNLINLAVRQALDAVTLADLARRPRATALPGPRRAVGR